MKKNITLFFLSFVFMGLSGRAQTPMSIPNGSFEQWTSHSGYSVTVIFMPLEVYDTFSTPSVWNYPSYPVNQTISFMGMNVNINTSVPIVKTTRVTGAVPDGNTAVKLHTIMLEDIVNPTVLSLAGSYIDSSLTQQVIPSILTTGAIDINAFIPLISNMMSGTGDLYSLLPTLLTEDVNDYITGGLPLNGFKPGRITGSYKYHSATSGDNGGVMMLGTRYNTSSHKREVVGGGVNISLTDVNVFTPFEVEYQPLSALVPGSPHYKPDSLIVILFSSAGTNMQQGSYLCLDNLELWPAPDTCASVLNLTIENQVYDAFPEMVLEWTGTSQPDHWLVEYGPQGFPLGSGTVVETDESRFEIYELENAHVLSPNTWYDFYVRSVCEDSIYGDWDSVHYRTPCASVGSVVVNGEETWITDDNMIGGYSISWVDTTDTRSWGLYYGIYNPLIDNWGTYVAVDTPYFEFLPLQPGKAYSVEITANCGEDNYGDIVLANFNTPNLEGIDTAGLPMLTISPNPANGQCTVTLSDSMPAELKLYVIDGRLVQTVSTAGTPVVLTLPEPGIFLLHATTPSGTSTGKIVNR